MIQFPSDRNDAGAKHVAGSQQAANEVCAQNMREGAIRFRASRTPGTPTKRTVQPARSQSSISIIGFVCMALAILAVLIGVGR